MDSIIRRINRAIKRIETFALCTSIEWAILCKDRGDRTILKSYDQTSVYDFTWQIRTTCRFI